MSRVDGTHPAAGARIRARLPDRSVRRPAYLILAWAIVAGLLRLPFVWTGLSMDEGGYAHVAQQWSRGVPLYREAWLDRPQGLLLTYRLLLWLDEGGASIRVGAVAAGVVITVALGVSGWLLAGRRAGVLAAALYAVVGVAPRLEGFTLNGELLAGVPSTVAVAAALLWRRYRTPGWLVGAGVAAGAAVTMKPSGLDGIAVGAAVVLLGTPAHRRPRAGAVFLAATAVPVLACAAHGWLLGWSDYWTALAGYQLAALGDAGTGPDGRWAEFTRSLGTAGAELTVVGLAAGTGLRAARRRRAAWLPVVWLAAAAVGVQMGGSYWPHYYVQLLPPFALSVAVVVVGLRRPPLRVAAVAVAVLPQLVWLAALVPATPAQRESAVPYAGAARRDARVAAVIRAHTAPGDRIFVLVSEANIYFLAQRRTDYPYLWGKPIEKIPEALPRLRAMLAGPDRPRLVVLNHDPRRIDPTGQLGRLLAEHYRLWRHVDGVPLLRTR